MNAVRLDSLPTRAEALAGLTRDLARVVGLPIVRDGRRRAEIHAATAAAQERVASRAARAIEAALDLEQAERRLDGHVERCGRCRSTWWTLFRCALLHQLRRERAALDRQYRRAYTRLLRGH